MESCGSKTLEKGGRVIARAGKDDFRYVWNYRPENCVKTAQRLM
jgi:hypothetical protein